MKGMWLICEVLGHQQGSEKVTLDGEAASTRLLRRQSQWMSLRKWSTLHVRIPLARGKGCGVHTNDSIRQMLLRGCPGAGVSS